jgi:hypothetical protein
MTQLRITTAVNDDITGLLAESVIGTPESGMLCQHKSIDKRNKPHQSTIFRRDADQVGFWSQPAVFVTVKR